jgi:hypothetical protein
MLRLFGKLLLAGALTLSSVGARVGDFQPVSSTDQTWRPEGAHLTLGAALKIAEGEALRRHIALSDFQAPWFRYDYSVTHPDLGAGYYVWVFTYEAKSEAPDNDLQAIVTDRTGYVELIPGQ